MLKFGFENEYFLEKDGAILGKIPDYKLPHDARGILVEVRSDPFENPFKVLASFNEKYAELEAAVAKFDCKLTCLQQHQVGNRLETAGFHIHFSKPEWNGLAQARCDIGFDKLVPADITKWIATLDARFESSYTGVKRHPHYWRPKPYGWEYRRLPATVNPMLVATILAEEFYKPLDVRAAA